ncbi:hypothetical protein IV102_26800 [bacterium]|nr:hypothetical protein [bacterium]
MNQELIDLILDGAVLVRQSSFTLAVEKAQEKLKKFQLPDPRYYITQIMQALLASGATKIEIFTDALRVRIVFDGPGYTREELERIHDAVFESGKNRDRDKMRELALGLLSVQALGPSEVSVTSNRIRWDKGGPRGKLSPVTTPHNEIVVIHRRAATNEMQILRQACQSCQADMYINNLVLSSAHAGRLNTCPWPNYAFKGPNFRGAFGIAYGEIAATSLSLTRYGVIFSKRSESRILPALIVEMEHELLRKNASQSDVVEDENYSAMLSDLQKVQLEFTVQLAAQRIPSYQAQQVYSYFQEVILQNLSRELLALPAEELGRLENQLADAYLLPTADGRRCSARRVWESIQQYGAVLYSEDSKMNVCCEPGTVLRLSEAAATSLRPLFPELRKLRWLTSEECATTLQSARQERSNSLPQVLTSHQHEQGIEVVVLDAPPATSIQHYTRTTGPNTIELNQPLGETPLSFSLISAPSLKLSETGLQRALKQVVEPLYLRLARQLDAPGALVPNRPGLQRAVFHFLEYKFGRLCQALGHPDWKDRALFWTGQQAPVSLNDLHAWLEVYPAVVCTYGLPVGGEDHALVVTPPGLRALRHLLGNDQLRLSELAQPLLVERSQQMGLSGAATAGVRRTDISDEDEELAAIRREIEDARSGGLQFAEEQPLDAEGVLQHLRLQPKATDLAEARREQQLPEFCQKCLAASKNLGTRWLVAFRQPGIQGQLLVHDGALPKPLQPDHLLVKVADNDPVAYSTRFIGLSGWLFVPANWEADPDFQWPGLRADSEPPQAGQSWPAPDFPFDLGSAALHSDLLWAIRQLYKLAAQHCAKAKNSSGPGVQTLWSRRLSLFLLWDESWALANSDSWFALVPLWRNLAGETLDLKRLRQLNSPAWAPAGPGIAEHPEQTVRLLPPFEVADLERLLGRQLSQASLQVEEKREQQLLGELKQWLVRTCQRAHAPLEAAWVEGLKFGQPTRWIGGPRKYFIEHQANEATTSLNPADALFIRMFRDQKGWEQQVPVLASAVYTAINRALSEVEDEHELAYLEAMLAQLP